MCGRIINYGITDTDWHLPQEEVIADPEEIHSLSEDIDHDVYIVDDFGNYY